MARYRRTSLSDGDRIAASAVSLLVGAGAAVATFYVTRLLLSREELPGRRSDSIDVASLPESSAQASGYVGSGRAGESGRDS